MNYINLNLGFTPEYILSVRVDPRSAHYKAEQLNPVYHQVLDSIKAVPGVQSASFATSELAAGPWLTSGISIEGHPTVNQRIREVYVNPSYFSTVGMHLVSGRLFDGHDTAPKPIAAVINQTAAQKYFPGESSLGRRFGNGATNFEVIGVVDDARIADVHESVVPIAFNSLEQSTQYANSLEIRAQGSRAKSNNRSERP
ncbi:MAG TPA: ABC transporter permease [Bryobacteraceae bacterium]|nr:ABC transporter permease [Bryobacteraceae bacterium]